MFDIIFTSVVGDTVISYVVVWSFGLSVGSK